MDMFLKCPLPGNVKLYRINKKLIIKNAKLLKQLKKYFKDLSYNSISTIDANGLYHLKQLKELDLTGCGLSTPQLGMLCAKVKLSIGVLVLVAQRRTSFEVYVFLHFLQFFEVEIHQKRFIIFLLQRATRVRMDWIDREVNFRKLSSNFVKNSKLSTTCNFKGSDSSSMFNFNVN